MTDQEGRYCEQTQNQCEPHSDFNTNQPIQSVQEPKVLQTFQLTNRKQDHR